MMMDAMEMIKDERQGLPSASGMQRLFLCPGSWNAERKCPHDEESEDAAMGTMLHACMEQGTTPEDPEDAEAVAWCREMEDFLCNKYLGSTDVSRYREVRLFERGDRLFSGKPDMVAVGTRRALVVDYKFGRLPVAAAECNLQLSALAVLVMDMFEDGAVDEVFVCILQPYASRKEPAVCRYTRESVEQARAFFRACIEQAQDEHAPLKPSEKACRYCRAQSSCPAVKLALVNVTSGDLTAAWEEWSPEKRREAYDLAKLAKKWAASVEAKVKADLKAELEIPGLCLTSGKKAFTVTDAAAAFQILNGLFPDDITAQAFTACCKVGITDLDKLVHSVRKAADAGAKVAESKDWLRKTLAGCAEVKVSDGSVKEVEGGAA
ncbi:MAG: DUF2800 domain-containing protein [Akkermansia muciniphila]|uniref:DUF2800 domain-containing protein n=1 Tax=Akkermansia TaxID=239934 RepID=UPI0015E096C3|nr:MULTISPECIES: DUF2800 domain-containing protein [Akkermansia]MCI9205651.1 DUF2800 domain-containing protein [Akkermansia muciniphila]QWO99893.1 DUF2800 domain-containing protein [Akkermansia muciniphila]QWP43102.1 DUF2800 domain-containing protein [Akkermansia muciniphila]WMB21381.1 DUF2800 domain-containing protein [Akkermansia muciniphila]